MKLTRHQEQALAIIDASVRTTGRGYCDYQRADAAIHSNTLNKLLKLKLIQVTRIDHVIYYVRTAA